MPTQTIAYGQNIKYDWETIGSARSLKNSHSFMAGGNRYLCATDMLRGGTLVLKETALGWNEHLHCFPGYKMMWAPHATYIDGQLWFLCCDTAGGDVSHWWDYMRLYRHTVDLQNKSYGSLVKIDVPEEDCGLIDPCLVQIGSWWYLFYAKLWDPQDKQWWDPHYSVSRSPDGPFSEEIYLAGIWDRGIDEAFKVFIGTDRRLYCTWSSGESGINGTAFLGALNVTDQHKDGWLYFMVDELAEIRAGNSDLCTALDVGLWPNMIATLRGNYTGMRDGFYLGELI